MSALVQERRRGMEMAMREKEWEEDDGDGDGSSCCPETILDLCPKCQSCGFKYFVIFIFVTFFLVVPLVMIYIGVAYSYCDDMFSIWLAVGGFLCYADCLALLLLRCLKNMNKSFLYTLIGILSVALLVWWVFGFGRIYSGAMNEETVMSDPVCKKFLYNFPFWLTLAPFALILLGFVFLIIYAVFCD